MVSLCGTQPIRPELGASGITAYRGTCAECDIESMQNLASMLVSDLKTLGTRLRVCSEKGVHQPKQLHHTLVL